MWLSSSTSCLSLLFSDLTWSCLTHPPVCISLRPAFSHCARSLSPPSTMGCFHGNSWNSMMPRAFWSCSSGSCPIHYWPWSTSAHLLLSTVCTPSVHEVFCSITRALQPHHETMTWEKKCILSISLCACVCFTELPTKKQQLQALNLLVLLLPEHNRDTLKVGAHSHFQTYR